MALELSYIIFSFVIGMLIGLTGVGGGSLMTPALIVLFGIQPLIAVGTDLVAIFVTKMFGTLSYLWQRAFVFSIVFHLLIGSVPASLLTLQWLKYHPPDQQDDLVTLVLLIVVVLTLLIILIRPVIVQWQSAGLHQARNHLLVRHRSFFLMLSGAVLGFLVSISSVGGGVLGLAIIGLLYPSLPIRLLVGSDLLHTLVLTLIAGAGHLLEGRVDYELLFFLISGGVPGVLFGSILMRWVSDQFAKYLIVGVLSAVMLVLSWYQFF